MHPPDITAPPWQYRLITPAGGLEYYNPATDQVAVVYRRSIKLYFDRVEGATVPLPCHYYSCAVYEV